MATAFAERERDRRGLGDRVEIVTGGTMPADSVHDVVVEALAEVGLDVNGRTPQHVSDETLAASDFAPRWAARRSRWTASTPTTGTSTTRASARSRRYVRSATDRAAASRSSTSGSASTTAQ